MANIEYGKVFSDWLSLSYSASNSPVTEILSFLDSVSAIEEVPQGSSRTLYKVSDFGTLLVRHDDCYQNFSFTGGVLAALRRLPNYRDFVLALGSYPSNVTRLDAALDLPISANTVIRNIDRQHPSRQVEVAGHKRSLQFITDSLGEEATGTVYLQNRRYSGYIKIRVYDKTKEMLDKGIEIPPTTRYEIEVHKGASLKDFCEPLSVFWHYMPSSILSKPKSSLIPSWEPTERIKYDDKPISHTTDYEQLRRLIQSSFALKSLATKSAQTNGGSRLLLRELEALLSLESRRD